MCGIAGFSISDIDHKIINTRNLSKNLLRQIMVRGRDATGAVWSESFEGRTELFFQKAPVDAETFIKNDLDLIPRFTRTALLHTRWATKGSPQNNGNNHPISVPGVVGVHNGHIANDDEVFEYFGAERIAEVDSEAIFQLIAHSENPTKDFCLLEGNAAFAWFMVHDPQTMNVVRLRHSPLWVGKTRNESLVFASTKDLLIRGVNHSNLSLSKIWEVKENTYFKVVKGEITECISLDTMNPVKPDFMKIGSEPMLYNTQPKKAVKSNSLRQNMDRLYGYR
jgi:glucosamine 6-phosphate synthetase-like amidotransferase/phosphosugar isomerase protein